MAASPRVSGHTVVATDGHAAYAYDLVTGTRTPFGPGSVGTTDLSGLTGNLVAGDTFPGPLAFAYRVDTGLFTALPGLGGPWSIARSSDARGAIAGNSAVPRDPTTGYTATHAVLWIPQH